MRYLLFIILGAFVLTACHTKRVQLSSERVCANVIDTLALQRKQLYDMRLAAQLTQLKDYIEFIADGGTGESSEYYIRKVKDLFAKDSKIIVTDGDDREALSIDSFFHFIAKREIVLQRLDSVEVPLWEESRLLTGKDSIAYVRSQLYMFSGKMANQTNRNVLPVVREGTEEGDEWMPLLGNLYVDGDLHVYAHKTRTVSGYSFKLADIKHLPVIGELDPILYKTRVKLMDEFFDRFNGKEQRIDAIGDGDDNRLTNLLLLFDGQMFQSFEDSVFQEAVRMASVIQSDSVHISDTDTTWMAKAVCRCTLKGKPVELTIYLNMEQRKEDMYKWVITKVEGDCLKLTPSVESEKIMLMPNAHENSFFALTRLSMEVDDYVTNYARKDYQVDETTVFYAYVYSGLLDIKQVSDLEFIFLQVPGYVFSVKHYERDTFNAGWLISSFKRMSDEEKQTFMDSMYRN